MNMYKTVSFIGHINERTGYGIHASRFVEQLSKIMELKVNVGAVPGAIHISLVDSVSIQNINERLPYPSILYNVWESTEQPQWFIDRLKFFDQLWVHSEWQRAASIAQGIPEEFVKVVPEGVDPEIYKPGDKGRKHFQTHGNRKIFCSNVKESDIVYIRKIARRKKNHSSIASKSHGSTWCKIY